MFRGRTHRREGVSVERWLLEHDLYRVTYEDRKDSLHILEDHMEGEMLDAKSQQDIVNQTFQDSILRFRN
eukprot:15356908-Ditylum_brightwellii.AAC.1